MATVTYDTENIRAMNLFESITGVEVRDVILKEDEAYFVVPDGKAGMAIGKGGKVVKKYRESLTKMSRSTNTATILENSLTTLYQQT